MSSFKNLYPGGTTATTTGPVPADLGTISLRDEMISLLTGTDGEIPKGQTFILRRMRRDDDGNLTECACVDTFTQEASLDFRCSYCYGHKYLFDEELVTGYKTNVSSVSSSRAFDLAKTEFGALELPAMVFFFDYSVEPTLNDKIVLIELDLEGDPIIPYNRTFLYEINLLRDLRSDRGRVEFWACYCANESIKTKGGYI